MRFSKYAATIPALALAAGLGISTEVHASTLVVDRGLPTDNLNNAAGGDRSNVTWGFTAPDPNDPNAPTTKFQSGDTFSLPPTGTPSRPSWRVDKLTSWFTAGSPNPNDNFQLDSRFSGISLFLGADNGPGSSIDRVANSSITGNAADAANVSITPVTYDDNSNYQDTGGSDIQIWQVDFTDLGTFSAGDYAFSVAGLPDENTILFNHASNAALGGVPADDADDLYAFLTGSAGDTSLTFGGSVDSDGNGWDKSSDINVQVTATPAPIPVPAALPLLLAGLGGLGLVARRKRKAA